MKTQDRIEQALLALFVITHAVAIPMALLYPSYFAQDFAIEDGPVEYMTAIFLFAAGATLIWYGARKWRQPARVQAALLFVYALLYLFVAGEEISWGQRIFGWHSGEYFQANNYQDETNLHNLVVGDTQLAQTLFGNWLTPVLLLYLLVLPLVWRFVPLAQRICRAMVIPVPRPLHTVLALIASLTMVAIMGTERQFELYEYAFGLMSLMIFLRPWNAPDFVTSAARTGDRSLHDAIAQGH